MAFLANGRVRAYGRSSPSLESQWDEQMKHTFSKHLEELDDFTLEGLLGTTIVRAVRGSKLRLERTKRSSPCNCSLKASFNPRAREVATRRRPEGVSRGSLNKSRNRRSCEDMAGWLMPNCSAAAETLSFSSRASSAKSRPMSRCFISILVIPTITNDNLSYRFGRSIFNPSTATAKSTSGRS